MGQQEGTSKRSRLLENSEGIEGMECDGRMAKRQADVHSTWALALVQGNDGDREDRAKKKKVLRVESSLSWQRDEKLPHPVRRKKPACFSPQFRRCDSRSFAPCL